MSATAHPSTSYRARAAALGISHQTLWRWETGHRTNYHHPLATPPRSLPRTTSTAKTATCPTCGHPLHLAIVPLTGTLTETCDHCPTPRAETGYTA